MKSNNYLGLILAFVLFLVFFQMLIKNKINQINKYPANNSWGNIVSEDFNEPIQEDNENKNLTLVVFSADWCGVCSKFKKQTMATPEFQKLCSSINCKEINVDQEKELSKKYGIRYLPTIVLIDENGKVLAKEERYLTSEEVLELVNKNKQIKASFIDEDLIIQTGNKEIFHPIFIKS